MASPEKLLVTRIATGPTSFQYINSKIIDYAYETFLNLHEEISNPSGSTLIPGPTPTPEPTTNPTPTPTPTPTSTPKPPTPTPVPSAESHLFEGQRLYNLGLLDAAILEFDQAIIKQRPGSNFHSFPGMNGVCN